MKTRTVIYADEGMILTNGENYGKQIFLADDADISHYSEITEEEYEKREKEGSELRKKEMAENENLYR